MSVVVGIMLLVLVGVAMPVQYIGHKPTMANIVSVVHGLLYIVYLLSAADLARRARFFGGAAGGGGVCGVSSVSGVLRRVAHSPAHPCHLGGSRSAQLMVAMVWLWFRAGIWYPNHSQVVSRRRRRRLPVLPARPSSSWS